MSDNPNAPRIVQVIDGGRAADIADRLDTESGRVPLGVSNRVDVLREAAALIRVLDRAISHMVAVKGSLGLSPWAVSVLHEAITRQQRRGNG